LQLHNNEVGIKKQNIFRFKTSVSDLIQINL